MRTRSSELTVGIFVIVAALALFFLAMKVSGLIGSNYGDTYTLSAQFNNVNGLKPRAKISISGVTVGRVKDIHLDPETLQAEVVMDIDSKVNTIDDDAYVMVATNGILGEKYLKIVPGAGEKYYKNGDVVTQTQGSMDIEDLINKFITGNAGASKTASAADMSSDGFAEGF
ncbi:outer membrane lipid asymmetry maintenance protein MlaD [Alkanindiges sp. WGS2144]|uniref:outer membrane lipid asymmetry maintenance protein MlaD n=1 Tax=Alkanindiges sp. WGS2144 TaxID=3366808 RepID=UPI0037537848